MAEPAVPCVLVVADRDRVGELTAALSELPHVEVVASSGSDDAIDLFEAKRAAVVVVTASLEEGDPKSLIAALRARVPRGEVIVVMVGDEDGPIRTALDALDLAPDRFVTRPLSGRALRFAVTGGLDTVRIVRGNPPPLLVRPIGTSPGKIEAGATMRLVPPVPALRPRIEPTNGSAPKIPMIPGLPPRTATPAPEPVPMKDEASEAKDESAPAPAPSPAPSPSPSPSPSKEAMRARWAALADSFAEDEFADDEEDDDEDGASSGDDEPTNERQAYPSSDEDDEPTGERRALDDEPTGERRALDDEPTGERGPRRAFVDGVGELEGSAAAWQREAIDESALPEVPARAERPQALLEDSGPTPVSADPQRWARLVGSVASATPEPAVEEPAPLPPPVVIKPRRHRPESTVEPASGSGPTPLVDSGPTPLVDSGPTPLVDSGPMAAKADDADVLTSATRDAAADELPVAPPREPTLIMSDPGLSRSSPPIDPDAPRTRTGDRNVVVAARTSSDEIWSDPEDIPAMLDRLEAIEPIEDALDFAAGGRFDADDRLDAHESIDELGFAKRGSAAEWQRGVGDAVGHVDADGVVEAEDDAPPERPSERITMVPPPRDYARELRAKMSMMAQRLFHGTDVAGPSDHLPRHDHRAEIDLASIGDEPALGAELDVRAAPRTPTREMVSSPSTWDTQVRERGLPDAGMIMRGVSDAAMLLARMFAQGSTGRIVFRRDDLEAIVYFDHGRPVFASSNEPRDRMGELLVREGKITASQLERCQSAVAESGRRMGEILVDLGYLKRRELLPAVRRHVEDIVYSLFGWERGSYAIALDAQPTAERIRLSRHPASLILEGIRRKLDRSSLERLLGPASTVVEVRDRERLGGIINLGDLALEERAALAAFDGQADLAQVARTVGVDLADVLPLAWGLCVLGLATARRTDTEIPDEAAALVGETDLAIDRERVRARWQLVTDADYFALLGVRRDATTFEIRRAYQAARRDFAADCFPIELRRELARELDDIAHVLDEAFRVLRDDRLRQTYLANLIDR